MSIARIPTKYRITLKYKTLNHGIEKWMEVAFGLRTPVTIRRHRSTFNLHLTNLQYAFVFLMCSLQLSWNQVSTSSQELKFKMSFIMNPKILNFFLYHVNNHVNRWLHINEHIQIDITYYFWWRRAIKFGHRISKVDIDARAHHHCNRGREPLRRLLLSRFSLPLPLC